MRAVEKQLDDRDATDPPVQSADVYYRHITNRRCNYVSVWLGGASNLIRARDRVLELLRPPGEKRLLLTLHIRRGDVVSECDTTAARVAALARNVSAALLAKAGFLDGSWTVVYFTDDEDAQYLSNLTAELHAAVPNAAVVVRGDALAVDALSRVAGPPDNFEIFAVGLLLRAAADADIRLRRFFDCGRAAIGQSAVRQWADSYMIDNDDHDHD